MAVQTPFCRLYLQALLEKRRRANPAYSLRAFARSVDLSPSALSRILSGKRVLSVSTAKKLADKLKMPAADVSLFIKSVVEERQRRSAPPELPEDAASPAAVTDEFADDVFQATADLYHIAILELTFVENFKSDPAWIAKALGIPLIDAKLALERLERLGLIQRDDQGQFVKTNHQLRTRDRSRTTAAHKLYQEQILKGAVASLKRDPIERRSMTSMTMAIAPEKLAVARMMIEDFMESLCQVLEAGTRRQVYQLGVSLYPLQREPAQARDA